MSDEDGSRTAWVRPGVWLLVTALALTLRWLVPAQPFAAVAKFDDGLMVRDAHAILTGNWLGAWDTLTLAKPAGYPLFLVLAWELRLSPAIAATLVLVLGACLVFTALRRFRVPFGLATAVYAALLFNPALLSEQASRVYRDGFMASLVVVIAGAALWTGIALRQSARVGASWHRGALAASALGISLGWLYITKSQVSYVFAALAVALILAVVVRVQRGPGHRAMRWRGPVMIVVIGGVAAVLPIAGVVWENHAHYGYAGTDDFYTGAYATDWQAWAQVEAGAPRAYVPITRAQREAIYAVSPTAARLAPFLEVGPGQGWRGASCQEMAICDESGAWFVWDLRDALVNAGLAPDEPHFQAANQQIAREIRAACGDGRLRCSSVPAPVGMPPLDRLAAGDVIMGTRDAVRTTVGFADVQRRVTVARVVDPESVPLWSETVVGAGDAPDSPLMSRRIAISVPIVTALAWTYQAAAFVLGVPIALLCLLHVMLGRTRRRLSVMALLLLASILVWALESGIVAAGAGPFYASSSLYALPVTSMLILGIALGVVSMVQIIRSSLHRRRRSAL